MPFLRPLRRVTLVPHSFFQAEDGIRDVERSRGPEMCIRDSMRSRRKWDDKQTGSGFSLTREIIYTVNQLVTPTHQFLKNLHIYMHEIKTTKKKVSTCRIRGTWKVSFQDFISSVVSSGEITTLSLFYINIETLGLSEEIQWSRRFFFHGRY